MTKMWSRAICVATGSLVIVTTVALPAAAATTPSPGTGLTGACNMLHDATMASVPMANDAAPGNAGMFHAVDVSGCA
jgi:hypothetical protein